MSQSTSSQRYGFVIGHGLDIVDIAEFSRLLSPCAINYLDRYFTDDECAAAGSGLVRAQRLAGRFAVKEAVMKALGVGWGNGVSFTDVEVVTLETGAPTIVLKRSLGTLATELAITNWSVTISHTNSIAVASVIATGGFQTGACL